MAFTIAKAQQKEQQPAPPSGRKETMIKVTSPVFSVACSVLLSACATPVIPNSPAHISEAPRAAGSIPEPVQQSMALPAPKPAAKVETYSVTVYKVPVQSLLFALARDAGLNVDVHPGIEGTVTLNALDQTLQQLLSRIQRQVDMRYDIQNGTLTVMPDSPEWRNYKVDYVNIARSTSSSVNIATQISTTGGGDSNNLNPVQPNPQQNASQQNQGQQSQPSNGANGNGSNNSTTVVNNRSDNNFWYNLERNIRDMLRNSNLSDNPVDPLAGLQQTPAGQQGAVSGGPGGQQLNLDAAMGAGRNRQGSSVIVNAEGGLIAVRATGRQHEKIRQFLDVVLGAAKRQVLIEATIIEVKLGDQYQQGINWSYLGGGGLSLNQGRVGSGALPSGLIRATRPACSCSITPTRLAGLATSPPRFNCWNRSARSKCCRARKSA
jgi:MSHA biogenesis protein MshL